MTEEERRELAATVAGAHAGLREVAFELRRALEPKAPAQRCVSLPEVRRGGTVIDMDRIRRRRRDPASHEQVSSERDKA